LEDINAVEYKEVEDFRNPHKVTRPIPEIDDDGDLANEDEFEKAEEVYELSKHDELF